MNQLYKLVLAVGLFAVATTTHSEIQHIGSVRAFEREIEEHKHAVVLFYDGRNAGEAVRRFKKNSALSFYQQAGLYFYAVDTAERRQLMDLADEFDINPGMAALVLYRNGAPVTNLKGDVVVLTHINSSSDIEAFIDKYLGDHLENVVAKKRRHERVHAPVVERVYYKPEPKISFGFGLASPVVACCPAPCFYECAPRTGFGFSIGL